MIYYVSGAVTSLEPGLAVIECGGVGYGCRITAYTAGQLKLNTDARLYITESIREDAFDLYGFISKEEQRCFELLTSVTGVGPKAAMGILSSGGPQNVTLAIMTGDEKLLTAAPGVGKKLAQRIILELKDKLMKETPAQKATETLTAAITQPGTSQGRMSEAQDALMVLGYSRAEALSAMQGLDISTMELEDIIRAALKKLMK